MTPIQMVRDFIQQSLRVLRVSYHPTPEEFNMTAKITGLGMVLIGIIGYLITVIFNLIEKV